MLASTQIPFGAHWQATEMLRKSNARHFPQKRRVSKVYRALSSAANSPSPARRRRNISQKPSNGWPRLRTPPSDFRRIAMKITAAVVHERSGPFTVEQLELCDPRPDELLVEVVASGLCAT